MALRRAFLSRAFLICALALSAAPAASPANSTELAFLAPADIGAGEVRSVTPILSAAAGAVEVALAEAEATDDAREQAMLDEIRDFYEARGYAPLWLAAQKPSRQMNALRRRMDAAAQYGLDPAPYLTPRFARLHNGDARGLAEADIEFSRAIARFVTHIASGRLQPAEVSRIITLEPEFPAIADVLSRLSSTAGIAVALIRYEPPHAQYRALKAKLAELQTSDAEDDRILVPEGDLLKPGEADERVPQLRKRLGTALADAGEPEIYDEPLVTGVKAFQAESGLTDDGIIGPHTLVALNGFSLEDDIAAVLANMERWRWMPRDLGGFHVMVNAPEFMVRVVKDGAVIHETRVIVGAPKHRTPTFSHVIDHLIVNPYWNVPASIVANEILPEIRENPYGYFSRHGYQVFASSGGRYRQIDPNWVDWYWVNPNAIRIRQVPGDRNALGRIKFMFPNQHSVYLHDTPTKKLFERDYRALSHGCVRVQNPLDFADAILPVAAPDWNSGRLEKLYGGKERRVDLDTPVPVHLAYFTISIDAAGEIRRSEDIYAYDEAIAALLRSEPEG